MADQPENAQWTDVAYSSDRAFQFCPIHINPPGNPRRRKIRRYLSNLRWRADSLRRLTWREGIGVGIFERKTFTRRSKSYY